MTPVLSFLQWQSSINLPLMASMELANEVVISVRRLKNTYEVPRNTKPDIIVCGVGSTSLNSVVDCIQTLAPCGQVTLTDNDPQNDKWIRENIGLELKVLLNLQGVIDIKKELQRLDENLDKIREDMKKLEGIQGKAKQKSAQKKLKSLQDKESRLKEHIQVLNSQ